MENKSWKQLIKDGATAKEIVRTQKPMNKNSWFKKCSDEGLDDSQKDIIVSCAYHIKYVTNDN